MNDLIEKKISIALKEQWIPDRPLKIEILNNGQEFGLKVMVETKNKSWELIHQQNPRLLNNEMDVDDLLADCLSISLMKHPTWPR